MPGYFSEAVAANLAGETVVLAILGRFDFPGGLMRLWVGHGDIELAGEVWRGLGEFVSLTGLTRSMSDAAVPLNITLSGVDDAVLDIALLEAEAINGRAVTIYLQPFTDAGAPLGSPVAIWGGSMDRLKFEGDGARQAVTLVCEGLFTNRSRAAFALMTDETHQRLAPGDRFFEHVAGVINKRVLWP